MEWITLAVSLMAGLVGGWASAQFQYWYSHRGSLEEGRFRMYMMLLELNGFHFWITSAEIRREQPEREAVRRFDEMRWRIADELRKADRLTETEDIVRVLFSLTFPSETDRSQALGQVIDRLGERVNPRYRRAVQKTGKENQELMADDFQEYWKRHKKITSL